MKKVLSLYIIIIVFASSILCSKADVLTRDGMIITSLVRLLAHPELYNGKRVEVMGYYTRAPEVSGLFLSRDAVDSRNIQLAVWVSLPSKGSEKNPMIQPVKEGFVLVRGTFKYSQTSGSGHLSMWPGEIVEVEYFKLSKTVR